MLKYMIFALSVVASTGNADEVEPWSTVGAWSVFVATPAADGCFTETELDGGTLVQLGSVSTLGGGFFAAYNAQWSDVEVGGTGTLKFDFGDALFAGDVVGKTSGGLPGGYAYFDNPNFVTEFAKRLSVTITGPKGKTVEISLKGSKKAIDAVLACEAEQSKEPSE